MGFHLGGFTDQVIVPVALGAVASVAIGEASIPFTQYPVTVGLVAGTLTMIYVAGMRTPKKYRRVEINSMSNRAEPAAAYNATVTGQPAVYDIRLINEEGSAGNYYRLTVYQREMTSRIAFHVLFMGGRMTHAYLEKEWQICKPRTQKLDEVRYFQDLYLEYLWMRMKGRDRRGGLELTPEGKSVFKFMANLYSPSPAERKGIRNQHGPHTSQTNKPQTNASAYPIGPEGGVGDGD